MSKAFVYSVLLHVAIVATAFVMQYLDIFSGRPLPGEPVELIDVEIADLTQTTERRSPTPEPKPEAKPEAKPEPKPEPKPQPEAKPEPAETKVAALPPQPEPVPEPAQPDPVPSETAQPETKPLPALPRPKPVPPKKDDFEMMLKDLNQELEEETPEKPEEKGDFLGDLAKSLDAPDPEPEPQRPQTQKTPNLGNAVTISERDAIARQFEPCWNIPIGARNPEELLVEVRVQLNRDGTVRSSKVVDRSRYNDPFYRAAAESAMRATLNKRCHPIKYPVGKFDQFRDLVLVFDTKKAIGR